MNASPWASITGNYLTGLEQGRRTRLGEQQAADSAAWEKQKYADEMKIKQQANDLKQQEIAQTDLYNRVTRPMQEFASNQQQFENQYRLQQLVGKLNRINTQVKVNGDNQAAMSDLAKTFMDHYSDFSQLMTAEQLQQLGSALGIPNMPGTYATKDQLPPTVRAEIYKTTNDARQAGASANNLNAQATATPWETAIKQQTADANAANLAADNAYQRDRLALDYAKYGLDEIKTRAYVDSLKQKYNGGLTAEDRTKMLNDLTVKLMNVKRYNSTARTYEPVYDQKSAQAAAQMILSDNEQIANTAGQVTYGGAGGGPRLSPLPLLDNTSSTGNGVLNTTPSADATVSGWLKMTPGATAVNSGSNTSKKTKQKTIDYKPVQKTRPSKNVTVK